MVFINGLLEGMTGTVPTYRRIVSSYFRHTAGFICLLALYGCEADGASDRKPDPVPEIKSEIPTLSSDVLDGFEGPEHSVWAFDAADDEGVARYVSDPVTQGKKALEITIKGKGKKGK